MPWAESPAIIDHMLEDNDMRDARTISTDELRQRLDHGHIAHLWNVLTSQYFTGDIIPGSTRMPLDTIGHATASVPKDAEIITYCGGPKCPQSGQAAQRLRELGYTNVRAYEEGLEGWKAAGHAVETLQEPAPAA
jgi:rhodanese-related sulfurtransferase